MALPSTSTTAAAVQQLVDQGQLAPGTEGWWRVYGAGAGHAQAGDLIGSLVDGVTTWELVRSTFLSRSYPLRAGLVNDQGELFTIGMGCPVVLLRRGEHNTLAD